MNIDRLKRLISIIASIPKEQFVMADWIDEDRTCGTAACAIGWATMDPEFREQGLGHKTLADNYCPTYKQYEHYDAASAFFGLPMYQTRQIFDPTEYPMEENEITPADVIRRIDLALMESKK